ncbi:hypothetical protein Nos7107_4708 [Nostoc sp. PCC 7107]|nr:hypothetical protein Nos7107_4708 [Nostoc sp. PCC 7107]
MSSNQFDKVFADIYCTGNIAKSLFDDFPDNIHKYAYKSDAPFNPLLNIF